jgi:hypothetical protein
MNYFQFGAIITALFITMVTIQNIDKNVQKIEKFMETKHVHKR